MITYGVGWGFHDHVEFAAGGRPLVQDRVRFAAPYDVFIT
jgi:hypothetical protein